MLLLTLLGALTLVPLGCSDRPLTLQRVRRQLSAREYIKPKTPPQITLIDQRGEPFHVGAETAGSLAYLYFGYTFCPDVCPITMATLGRALADLAPEQREQITPIFISLDPARDTPDRIGTWLSAFGEGFVGLTGTDEEVKDALRQMGYEMPPVPIPEEGPYEVAHPADLFVITPDREVHFGYPSDVTPDQITRDAAMLLDVTWPGIPARPSSEIPSTAERPIPSETSASITDVAVVGSPDAESLAIYATFTDRTGDTLLAIRTDIGRGSIHQMTMVDGLMRMDEIGHLPVTGNGPLLAPGKTHGMLDNLSQAILPGDTITLYFDFARAESTEVRALFLTHTEYTALR